MLLHCEGNLSPGTKKNLLTENQSLTTSTDVNKTIFWEMGASSDVQDIETTSIHQPSRGAHTWVRKELDLKKSVCDVCVW